jgi:hypothetical protein
VKIGWVGCEAVSGDAPEITFLQLPKFKAEATELIGGSR